MLEVLMIYSFVYAIRFWKLRGKSFESLNQNEQNTLVNAWNKDRAGKKKYTLEEYLPRVQKNAVTYLVMGIVLAIVWVFAVVLLYPTLLATA